MRAGLHWPEYAIEGACLAIFMVSAAGFATLLQHPVSPIAAWQAGLVPRRFWMGIAMGMTAIALIYSPLGRRSGAHMNPAVTLTFLRLGKVAPRDAVGYIAAQFLGGSTGIVAATHLLAGLPSDSSVNYVATLPGTAGSAFAFFGELLISFVLMAVVLELSNRPRTAGFTGIAAGVLVAIYILVESPLSGTSMNPARSLGSNVLAAASGSLWIYFTAPPLGMLLAAELFVRWHGLSWIRCAKLHHTGRDTCIFRCGHAPA